MLRRASIALTLVSLAAIGGACTAKISDPETDRRAGTRVGEIGLTLTLSPGQAVDGALYTISRSDGFLQRGMIPPGARLGFSALLALPEAEGYTIELAATSMGLHCIGSEDFDVWADRRVAVSVVMRCPGAQDNTGSVLINGRLNVCPEAHAIVASPSRGTVGEAIRLYGTASDPDVGPSPLMYAWSSTSGALGDQSDDCIDFICTEGGISAVTLVISDGDPGCITASSSLTIVCVDLASGGAGGASGMGSAGADASIPEPMEPDEDAGVAQ